MIPFPEKLKINVPTLGEEADLEAQTFNIALNPLFCQTCVSTSTFLISKNLKQIIK